MPFDLSLLIIVFLLGLLIVALSDDEKNDTKFCVLTFCQGA